LKFLTRNVRRIPFNGHLEQSSLGELWKDTFRTFEEALSRADRWHAERDGDHDWEWADTIGSFFMSGE